MVPSACNTSALILPKPKLPLPIPQSLLDMMIAEEESLKQRLLKSIDVCRKELSTLCKELQLAPFEVGLCGCQVLLEGKGEEKVLLSFNLVLSGG